jgi:hypothetical protein
VVVDGQYRLRPGAHVVVSGSKPDQAGREKTAEAETREIAR